MNLIINSRFNPYSYDELVRPLEAYTEQYNAMEEKYSDLAAQAEAWKSAVNREKNPIAYQMYKRYTDHLNDVIADFSRGMTLNNRRQFVNMKKNYSRDILPIANAADKKTKLNEEQRKLKAADPSLMFQRDADDITLDALIENPYLDYGNTLSGNDLAKQSSEMYANLKSVLMSKSDLKGLGLPYQYERETVMGATPEELLAYLSNSAKNGNTKAMRLLQSVEDTVYNSSGIEEWGNDTQKIQARNYIRRGAYSALGTTKTDNYTDSYSANYNLAKLKGEIKGGGKKGEKTQEEMLADYLKRMASIKHTEGQYLTPEKFKASALANFKNKFTVDGKGIRANIASKNRDGKMFINPLIPFNEAIALRDKYIKEGDSSYPAMKAYRGYMYGTPLYTEDSSVTSAWERAKAEIGKKYGVDVISESDAEIFRELGFDENSTIMDLNGSHISDALNDMAIKYKGSTLNLSTYDHPTENLNTYFNRRAKANEDNIVAYEVKDGKKGEGLTYEDLFGKEFVGGNQDNISLGGTDAMVYTALQPDMILINSDYGSFYVSPDVFDSETSQAVKEAKQRIEEIESRKDLSRREKNHMISIIQDETSLKLVDLFNSFNKERSNTSSEV